MKPISKFAVKAIQKSKIVDKGLFAREIINILGIEHKHLCKLHEVWEQKNMVYLVYDYCHGGNVFQYFLQQEVLSENMVKYTFKQIFEAIQTLHEHKIHTSFLDFKSFMFGKLEDLSSLKIIDYGITK